MAQPVKTLIVYEISGFETKVSFGTTREKLLITYLVQEVKRAPRKTPVFLFKEDVNIKVVYGIGYCEEYMQLYQRRRRRSYLYTRGT